MTACPLRMALTAVVFLAVSVTAAEPALRVATTGDAPNLIRNADFEQHSTAAFPNWSAAPDGFRVATGEGRNGSTALAVSAADETGWRGGSQTLPLGRKFPVPLVVRGWSRAEGVSDGADSGYSLYVDLVYDDGTPLWGQTANFGTGTHDWQMREVLIFPEKPVRSLSLYCLLRGHAGRVWFDDVSVTELTAGGGTLIFQGTPMEPVAITSAPPAAEHVFATADGLRLGLAGQRVVSVEADGRELGGGRWGGFLARDLAGGSDMFAFENGRCAELGLELSCVVRANADHLAFEGRLTSTRSGDRAILLVFALPLEVAGWTWGDDIRRSRVIEGTSEFALVNSVGCGTTGTMSVYPIGAVSGGTAGLALGLDPAWPAQYRFFHHAGTRHLWLALDLGLVPETDRFPSAAPFRFVVYRFDPAWGFRAAFRKYMDLFPEAYRVRAAEQGIWMPFTDVATVQGWEDFGFRFHEGDNAVAWDDAHGVLSFRYTEPMTWWMPMDPSLPRTEAEALRVRDARAAGAAGFHRDLARITRDAAMTDADGHPALLFRNTPWANGAVWSLNPNPALPASPNAATIYWNDTVKARSYGPGAAARLDGEYLDSLEGYVTADVNFRRDHFRHTTVPLSFATDSRRPVLFKGLAVYEFTRWISEDVRRLGGLMFANGVPYRYGFLCPWLDVLGTETDWLPGGTWQPASHAQMNLWRTLSGAKPYLLLMNTDYDRFTPVLVERYFQRSLFYGMFPSMFSHNAAENPYWKNPAWYNRDRPLFRKYLPLIRQAAQAGWQPVTAAHSGNPNLWLERFGPGADGAVYFTVLNVSALPQSGTLQIEPGAWHGRHAGTATELVSGAPIPALNPGWRLELAGDTVGLVRVDPGPRFAGVDADEGRVRLTIESPPGLDQVVEASEDLHEWVSVDTRRPGAARFVVELSAAPASSRFFRVRW